jgi:hypothetical protein
MSKPLSTLTNSVNTYHFLTSRFSTHICCFNSSLFYGLNYNSNLSLLTTHQNVFNFRVLMQRCLLHPTLINTHHFYTHHSPLTTHHTPIWCFYSSVLVAHAALSAFTQYSSTLIICIPITHLSPLTTRPYAAFTLGSWGSCSAVSFILHPSTLINFHIHHSPLTSHYTPKCCLILGCSWFLRRCPRLASGTQCKICCSVVINVRSLA